MSGEHAILAPSSAHMRAACPASRRMEAANPQTEETPEQREGTAAHWVAYDLIYTYGKNVAEGVIAPNNEPVTLEMIEAAELFVADINAARLAQTEPADFFMEQRVDCSYIHPKCWGTPDAFLFNRARMTLIIWDFKYGHRFVDAFENWQMLEYLAGIEDKLGINGASDTLLKIEFRVVQPRCYVGGGPIRSWSLTGDDARGYFNQLRNIEEAAMDDRSPATTNENCKDCAGAHQCRALQEAAYRALDVTGQPVPFDLPPDALGVELEMMDRGIEILEARRNALAEQAEKHIRSGQRVGNYLLEQSVGRQKWNVPDIEVLSIGEAFGVDLSKAAAITPKQAIKAGVPEGVVELNSVTPHGAFKLVQDKGVAARRVFSS